jgi:hypothetical protein
MSDASARRPAAPRPSDYAIVPGSQGPRRDFRISVGLREGWDPEGRVFDVSEAVRTARAWMKRRVEAGQPALSGRDGFRLRIGRCGAVFDEDASTILAIYVGRRETATYSRN